MATAASDTNTLGTHTPATVRLGASLPVRKIGTPSPDSMIWDPMGMEPSSHLRSAREALSCAIDARAIPIPSKIKQQKPSASGAVPIASLVERGSSSKKDGKVNASVTKKGRARGRTRNANNKSAEPRAERGRNQRHIGFHPRETAAERNTYNSKNTASETPAQRAANI